MVLPSILNNGLVCKIATSFYTSPWLNCLYYPPCLLLGTYASPCLQVVISDLSTTPSLCRSIPCTSFLERIFNTFYSTHGNTVNKVYCIGECVSIWNNSENAPIDTRSPSCIRFPCSVFKNSLGTKRSLLPSKLRLVCFSVPLTMAIL